MPKALSTKPEPYQHSWTPEAKYDEIYTGWAYPPKDYAKWGELAYQWARHCVEKYGRAEVAQWYWQTWNEANIGYWRGTPEEFRKLHDYAVAGVRRALPEAKVGGPDTAGHGGQWMRDFLGASACAERTTQRAKIGTPIDFVSFHAKGRPAYVDGHVRMGIANQLAHHRRGVPDRRLVSGAQGEADRDRRVRSGGVRRVPGPQLAATATRPCTRATRRRASPKARSGCAPRSQPRRGAHVGF